MRADAPDTIRLQAVYYDTDDFRLARAGASLRYRNVEGWTVKLPVTQEAGALDRQELHFDGDADDDPPEAALDLVHALARSAPLQPVARLNSVRTRVVLRDEQGAKIGEVVDDEVSVLDGIRLAARFRELEVELEEDAPESLEPALLARLRAAGAGHADPVPKIVRALGPRAADPPDVTPPPPLDFASTRPRSCRRRSPRRPSGCSSTTRGCVSVPTPSPSTRRGSPPAACAPTCAPSARCSTRSGANRSAPS